MSPEKNGLFLYTFSTWAPVEGVTAQGRQLCFSVSVWLCNNQNVALATRVITSKPTPLSIDTEMPKQPSTKDELCGNSAHAKCTARVHELAVKLQ